MSSETVQNIPALSIAKLIDAIRAIKGNAFVSFTYRSKETGELARHTVQLGADYGNTLRKSMEELTAKKHLLSGIDLEACDALIASYSKSLATFQLGVKNDSYACADVYESLGDGLKFHKESETLYIDGMAIQKKVLEAGVYKVVNSKPLTLAKNALAEDLPVSRYRQFRIAGENLQSVKIAGNEIDCQ